MNQKKPKKNKEYYLTENAKRNLRDIKKNNISKYSIIYAQISKTTNKAYIGQTIKSDVEKRWRKRWKELFN